MQGTVCVGKVSRNGPNPWGVYCLGRVQSNEWLWSNITNHVLDTFLEYKLPKAGLRFSMFMSHGASYMVPRIKWMQVSRLLEKILALCTNTCLPALRITLSREVLHHHSQNKQVSPWSVSRYRRESCVLKKRDCSSWFLNLAWKKWGLEQKRGKRWSPG